MTATWVIVADGGIVRVFEEVRRGVALIDRPDLEMRHTKADEVEDSDRPTRVFESAAGALRHAVETSDGAHEEQERRFLRRACAAIARAGAEGRYDTLVIFAPPRALGLIRGDLPEAVKSKIAATAPLDVVGETHSQISARLWDLRQP